MAKYMLLIFGDAVAWEALSEAERAAHDAEHAAFRSAAGPRVVGGEELVSASVGATTLRADADGGLLMTDGPFLETKEGLGGFYLLEAGDLDEVVALARLLPEVRAGHSGVEIRPVIDHG
ncbi:YciI family protein [Asanoa sp. NPDC050611]|uniref:YciI family protein n=1 Tax=Asanoa sp. NPDC050611 TaxID=3157098 RepID=UPI0033FC305B